MKRALLAAAVALSSSAFAGPTQKSFTPTGYQYPITRISIAQTNGSNEQVLYACTGSSADCLVDVASDAALQTIQNAATSVALEPGDYTQIRLQSCPAGTTGADTMDVLIQGAVQLSSGVYGTDDAATGGMTLNATPSFAHVTFGCGGAVVPLGTPLHVEAGSSQTLTLLVDLTHVTWTDANIPNPGMGGCRSSNAQGQGLCTAFPFIIPFLGDGAPTFERYLVSHLAAAGTPALEDANASISFAVDPSNHVFYVAGGPYFTETSPSEYDGSKGGPDYNASTRTFSTNPDGSIAFQTGGSVEDNRVGFTAFARQTHTGTCKNENVSQIWNYQAFKE